MNELYIYIKDQCEVKSQDITKNILVKITGVKEIMNKYFLLLLLLLLLLLFSYFVPIFYLIGLFGDVTKHFLWGSWLVFLSYLDSLINFIFIHSLMKKNALNMSFSMDITKIFW